MTYYRKLWPTHARHFSFCILVEFDLQVVVNDLKNGEKKSLVSDRHLIGDIKRSLQQFDYVNYYFIQFKRVQSSSSSSNT